MAGIETADFRGDALSGTDACRGSGATRRNSRSPRLRRRARIILIRSAVAVTAISRSHSPARVTRYGPACKRRRFYRQRKVSVLSGHCRSVIQVTDQGLIRNGFHFWCLSSLRFGLPAQPPCWRRSRLGRGSSEARPARTCFIRPYWPKLRVANTPRQRPGCQKLVAEEGVGSARKAGTVRNFSEKREGSDGSSRQSKLLPTRRGGGRNARE